VVTPLVDAVYGGTPVGEDEPSRQTAGADALAERS
jgi:hypothetical protein